MMTPFSMLATRSGVLCMGLIGSVVGIVVVGCGVDGSVDDSAAGVEVTEPRVWSE